MTVQSQLLASGVLPLSPMDNDGKVDLNGLSQHLKRLTEANIDVILLMGSIGEFASFTLEERLMLIRRGPRDEFAEDGCQCLLHLHQRHPAYGAGSVPRRVRCGDDSATVLLRADVEAASELLPPAWQRLSGKWFAYNFPARTGCDLTPDLVATLAAEFPNFAGIKDTVDCQSHTRSMIQTTRAVRDDFAVLSGYDEYYIPNLLAGGAGIISGLNNVMPELFVSAREAFKQGDLQTLRDIQEKIGTFMSIYAIGEDFVTTIKTVVSRKFGYCTGVSRNAGGELNEHERRTIDEVFGR